MTNGNSYGGSSYRVGSAPTGVKPPTVPPAPEFDRHVRFHRTQVYGLVLVAVLPVLSMFGLFGLYSDTVTTASKTVELAVSYPTTQRFKVRRPLRIELTNSGETALPNVEVSITVPYIFAFSDVALMPGPDDIDQDTYNFMLSDIGPGETGRIATEMQAQRYWRHDGTVAWSVLNEAGETVDSGSVDFSTMVWP